MKDWKGNKIEIGHNVLIVNVGSMFNGSTALMMFIDENGNQSVIGEPIKMEQKYTWEIANRYKIISGNRSMISDSKDFENEIGFQGMELWLSTQSWQILCIEGISDNEQDYYNEKFKI